MRLAAIISVSYYLKRLPRPLQMPHRATHKTDMDFKLKRSNVDLYGQMLHSYQSWLVMMKYLPSPASTLTWHSGLECA